MTNQVALITGASSGMGKAAALRFHAAGYTVFAGARHVDRMQDLKAHGIHVLKLDVTSETDNAAFVQAALDTAGRIDVLINNAGYGSMGAIEDVAPAEAKRQFEVNVFGALNLTQLVLPTMRRQHFGKIINNSSIGGQLYGPLGGWYYASKHALEALSDALRLEVKPFGIDVIIIEPGGTATNWQKVANDHMLAATPTDSAYRHLVEVFAHGSDQLTFKATGDDIAQLMLKAGQARRPKTRYQLALTDKIAVIAARKLSYRTFDTLINVSMRLLDRSATKASAKSPKTAN